MDVFLWSKCGNNRLLNSNWVYINIARLWERLVELPDLYAIHQLDMDRPRWHEPCFSGRIDACVWAASSELHIQWARRQFFFLRQRD